MFHKQRGRRGRFQRRGLIDLCQKVGAAAPDWRQQVQSAPRPSCRALRRVTERLVTPKVTGRKQGEWKTGAQRGAAANCRQQGPIRRSHPCLSRHGRARLLRCLLTTARARTPPFWVPASLHATPSPGYRHTGHVNAGRLAERSLVLAAVRCSGPKTSEIERARVSRPVA